jgi:hypothetical protein
VLLLGVVEPLGRWVTLLPGGGPVDRGTVVAGLVVVAASVVVTGWATRDLAGGR